MSKVTYNYLLQSMKRSQPKMERWQMLRVGCADRYPQSLKVVLSGC